MMEDASSSGKARLCALYAMHAFALGLWGVNFSNVLKAYGFEAIVPYAFACSSIAVLVSPLAVGALADQRMSAEKSSGCWGWAALSSSPCSFTPSSSGGA